MTTKEMEARILALETENATLRAETAEDRTLREQRLWQREQAERALRLTVNTCTCRLARLDTRIAEYEDLRAMWVEFEQRASAMQQETSERLKQAAGLSQVEEDALRRLQARLRDTAHEIVVGTTQSSTSFLHEWATARGLRPRPAAQSLFEGRPGLRRTERLLKELQSERSGVAASLETAKRDLDSLSLK